MSITFKISPKHRRQNFLALWHSHIIVCSGNLVRKYFPFSGRGVCIGLHAATTMNDEFTVSGSDTKSLIIGTLGFLAVASYYAYHHHNKKDKRAAIKRSVSFTSIGLGVGSFPPQANVKEPIINAAVYFDKPNLLSSIISIGSQRNNSGCPTAQDVAQQIITPFLEYERFSRVPDLERHTFRPSARGNNGKINTLDLIREFNINGDDEILNRTIVDHLQDTLGSGRDDLPWWEVLIFRNSGSGASACVLRVHHIIGDGLALVAAFAKLTASRKERESNDITTPPTTPSSSGAAVTKRKTTIWSLLEAAGHCLALSATKYDDDTVFSKMNHATMKHSGVRKALIFPTVPLDFVKKLKDAAGVTVNDIIMAAISQAIHDYCILQNDQVLASKGNSIQCRALLPVGFPRSSDELKDKSTALRNIWCMVSCDIGVGYSDIEERLKHIRAKTMEMKEKPRAYMQMQIQNKLAPLIPVSLGQQTVFDTFSRHSLVMTNVPGPSEEILFAGKTVKSVQLFFDNMLTQIDVISYAGQVYGNIIYDEEQLPSFDGFGQRYVAALVALANRLKIDVPAEVK